MNRDLRSLVVAIALLVVAACGSSETASIEADAGEGPIADTSEVKRAATDVEAETEPAEFKIVMLGDSLTAGFQLPPSDALPQEVERILRADGKSVDVINAGVSGDTTAGGLARYDWSVASADPDILVLALGANDYLNGIDPDQTRDNLSSIIERALADDVGVLLVSLSVRSTAASDPRAMAFAELFPELAQTYDIALYSGLLDPVFDVPDLLMQDGSHPNAEGVRTISPPLSEAIVELLNTN